MHLSGPSILFWQVLLFLTDGKPNEPWGNEQYAQVKQQALHSTRTPTPAQTLTLTPALTLNPEP